MEQPSPQLSLVDREIAGVLLNVGWILMLIGLEPVGARLITRSKIYSVTAVVVLTALGLVSLLAGIAWPPSSEQVRILVTPVIEPIAKGFVWILLFFVTTLWVVNAVPVLRAGDIATVRQDLKALQRSFDQYVMPRTLTKEKRDSMVTFLLKYPPRKVRIN